MKLSLKYPSKLSAKHSQVVQAILRHVNFDVAKAVLIASPGFVRQQFFDYMYQQVCSVDYSTRFTIHVLTLVFKVVSMLIPGCENGQQIVV